MFLAIHSYIHSFYLVLFYFRDSAASSHLGVIPYSDVFEVILNCLQYVSNISSFIQLHLSATVYCTRQSGVKPWLNSRSISTQYIATLQAQHLQGPGKQSHHFGTTSVHEPQWPNDYSIMQHPQVLLKKFEPTTPNTSQHIATGWRNVRNI